MKVGKSVVETLALLSLLLLTGCARQVVQLTPGLSSPPQAGPAAGLAAQSTHLSSAHAPLSFPGPLFPIEHPTTTAAKIVNGAKAEARRGVIYDASYASIPYPGGDVPPGRGACTDVVVRALRCAGFDLQKLIHQDMAAHFHLYPRKYGNRAPDTNIDHRRTLNQMIFFRRFGIELPRSTTGSAASTWQPGDLVYWQLSPGVEHCGVLSNTRGATGLPLVIHNLAQAAQEDCLTAWPMIGHFRYPPPAKH